MDNETFLKNMGAKFKAERKARKMSLEKMGKTIGMNMATLWFIENGQYNSAILTLKKIADYYGKELKDFM